MSAASQAFGEHLVLLRALSALAAAATVWVTMALARRAGARDFGAALAPFLTHLVRRRPRRPRETMAGGERVYDLRDGAQHAGRELERDRLRELDHLLLDLLVLQRPERDVDDAGHDGDPAVDRQLRLEVGEQSRTRAE
jgi:hypothetical protein